MRERSKSDMEIVTLYFETGNISKDLYGDSIEDRTGKNQSGEFSITKYADSSYDLSTDPTVEKVYKEYGSAIDSLIEIAEAMDDESDKLVSESGSGTESSITTHLSNITKEPREPLNLHVMERILSSGVGKLLTEYENCENPTTKFDQHISKIEDARDKVENTFLPALPNISYHHEYELISDSATISNMDRGENPTFRNLLSLANVSPIDIRNASGYELDSLRSRICQEATDKINEFWSQRDVRINLEGGDGNELRVYITTPTSDPTNQPVGEPPSERSDGFRWFFSHYVNMAADFDSLGRSHLVLLDEPAIHLHPKGKRDWLSTLDEMSKNVEIIYTSHSPYLIEKSYPSRIRTIEASGENQAASITTDIFESGDDTLEPLRNALGIGLGDSLFVSKRQIIVEGPADYYILAGIAVYDRDTLQRNILDWEEVAVTPAGGATEVPKKAAWFESEEIRYAMLLDSDEGGREVRDDIQNQYHILENGREKTVMLRSQHSEEDITIEDLFDPELYVDCFNTVYSRIFNDFEEVDVKETTDADDDVVEIDGRAYDGTLITDLLKDVLLTRGLINEDDDIGKVRIANELKQRLDQGKVNGEAISGFDPILGELKSITDDPYTTQ